MSLPFDQQPADIKKRKKKLYILYCWGGGKVRGMALHVYFVLPASYLEENMTTRAAFAL